MAISLLTFLTYYILKYLFKNYAPAAFILIKYKTNIMKTDNNFINNVNNIKPII